jgi:hypothetical protein
MNKQAAIEKTMYLENTIVNEIELEECQLPLSLNPFCLIQKGGTPLFVWSGWKYMIVLPLEVC